MKGIVLAGGSGTRLNPLTTYLSKQLLPIYDKPLIFYPLTTLMLAGITDILIITKKEDLPAFRKLLGDGSQWGISLSFMKQDEPEGLPQGLIIGEEFIAGDSCAFILGDNLFFGSGLGRTLKQYQSISGAQIFAHKVLDPERFGVIEVDENEKILSIEEKPSSPKSNLAITGLYFFDANASSYARSLKKSSRSEFEMLDLLQIYLDQSKLKATVLPRGTAWLDTGTFQAMNDASNFVRIIQENQGSRIGDPYEININEHQIESI